MTSGTNSNKRYILETSGVKIGPVAPSMDVRSKDFIYWLVDQVPEGGTIVEVLFAIADDAFADDTETTTSGTTPKEQLMQICRSLEADLSKLFNGRL